MSLRIFHDNQIESLFEIFLALFFCFGCRGLCQIPKFSHQGTRGASLGFNDIFRFRTCLHFFHLWGARIPRPPKTKTAGFIVYKLPVGSSNSRDLSWKEQTGDVLFIRWLEVAGRICLP